MKKISLRLTGLILLTSVLFTSCAKDGPAGPAGATGATGAAGPAGAAGAAGATGAAGTANVIYSAWLDVVYRPDTVHIGNVIDTTGYYTLIPAPKMTAAVIATGEIKVYWNINTATAPTVVPVPFFDGTYLINPYFYINGGVSTIELDANENLGTGTSNGVKFWQYRYILIPGGVPARSAINYDNYEEVKKYYNIPD